MGEGDPSMLDVRWCIKPIENGWIFPIENGD